MKNKIRQIGLIKRFAEDHEAEAKSGQTRVLDDNVQFLERPFTVCRLTGQVGDALDQYALSLAISDT